MPMFYIGRNMHHIAGLQLLGGLSPLLVISASSSNEEKLSAALVCMVDVPMVTASRLKRNIPNDHLVKRNHIKIALAVKILCIVDVFSANGKQAGTANRL